MCLALGRASPSALLRELRPRELALWIALWRRDPWGEQRADLRQALNTRLLAAAHFNRRDGGDWAVTDFMPYAPDRGATDGGAAASDGYAAARSQFAHLIVKKENADGSG